MFLLAKLVRTLLISDMKLRKSESRTYFIDKMGERVNRRMEMDEERERMRR